MKKLNNKGFSLVELLAAVTILGILSAIAVGAYTKYLDRARQQSLDTMAESASNGAKSYIMDYGDPEEKVTYVSFSELVELGYLDNATDPSDKNSECEGKVKIITKSGTNGELDSYNTEVVQCCKNYSYTYSYPNGTRTLDKRCKTEPYDINEITNIKVLNVYAQDGYQDNLKSWMNSYGKGKIDVTPVYINTFNSDPTKYLGTSGNWNYDVIVFGFSDCNSGKDLNATSSSLVSSFLSNGGAAIFGHDTITHGCGDHVNFIKLKDYVGLDVDNDLSWNGSTILTIRKEGIFTKHPYNIGNVGTNLTIKTTHTYGQIAKGDIWLSFNGDFTSKKAVYLSTFGNNAFIQTGHTNGYATDQEKMIIANIIFYAKAKAEGAMEEEWYNN